MHQKKQGRTKKELGCALQIQYSTYMHANLWRAIQMHKVGLEREESDEVWFNVNSTRAPGVPGSNPLIEIWTSMDQYGPTTPLEYLGAFPFLSFPPFSVLPWCPFNFEYTRVPERK
jgi:hypothetical protein